MALIVQKFGGSSVGDIQRIKQVADIILKTRAQGHQVVVVVSAMYGETERLISLAKAAAAIPNPREYDALISTGEQVSATLLSIVLQDLNYPACSFNAAQIPIRTDSQYKKSNILEINASIIQDTLKAGIIPVITGFQGVNEKGDLTTLGRGGSDMSAVALAAALNADECQIFTDVAGVYTSDPRIVKKARLLPEITFEEMLELSHLGAKVLQIRSVEYANRHNVPLRVLSTFEAGSGTLIIHEKKIPAKVVAGIAYDRNQAKVSATGLSTHDDSMKNLLHEIRQANIDIDMVMQNGLSAPEQMDLHFTVHQDDYLQALDITKQFTQKMKMGEVIGRDNVAKLSLVGTGIHSYAGVASKMYEVLGQEDIPIHLIASSALKISIIIDEKYTELGVRILHSAFNLDVEG